MANVPAAERISGSTFGNLSRIVSEQGVGALWRGNNANVYRNLMQICLRVTVYDRVKHAYMPQDASRYAGADFYWRLLASAAMTMGITAALTYPLDLIHTRLAADMSKKGQHRLYHTTFDCFNRTNIDEGFRKGLYKGLDLSVATSAVRTVMTLPLLDALRANSGAAKSSPPLQNFLDKIGISMLCSLTLSVALYPLDTAKRCMQLNGARGHFSHYKGSMDCIRKLMAQGGARGLYRGVHIYIIKEFITAFS